MHLSTQGIAVIGAHQVVKDGDLVLRGLAARRLDEWEQVDD